MTDRDIELQLRDWYRAEIGEGESAPRQLRADLAAIVQGATTSRRPFPVRWTLPHMDRVVPFALAGAAVLVMVLIGASILLPPSPNVGPSTSPTSGPSPAPGSRTGLVAYTHVRLLQKGVECPDYTSLLCYERRLWVANSDGTGAHALLPDVAGAQVALGWSPDGRWILFTADGRPKLSNPTGSDVRDLDVEGTDFAFSPDSTRLAFAKGFNVDADRTGSVLGIFDIATGETTVVESTRSDELGGVGRPRWSPDGAWIAFDRQVTGSLGERVANVLLVRPDGTELRTLTANALYAIDPDWSPDGSKLAFLSSAPVNGENEPFANDIYSIAVVGGDPVRLTSDGVSVRPSWTLGGQIVFLRLTKGEDPSGMELWLMSADGSGARRLDAGDLSGLSAIGCLACVYPPAPPGSELSVVIEAFWQPAR